MFPSVEEVDIAEYASSCEVWLDPKSACVAWRIQVSHVEPHQKAQPSVSTSYLGLSLELTVGLSGHKIMAIGA